MRRRTGMMGMALAAALGLGMAATGCGTGLTLDSTIGDVLNVLTSGDLAAAFDEFVGAAGSRGGGLSESQIAAIEDLQAQLDAGTLSDEAFAGSVETILGDRAPGMAFGGFALGGGPFGMHHPGRLADLLELTDEQMAEAEAIFTQLHTDIHDLRTQAKEDIRGVLTEEQLATLDALKPGGAMEGDDAMARPRGPRHGGHGSFSSSLAEILELTPDQQAEIDAIRTALREDVRAAHEAARDAFRAILTDEQLATLDAFEAAHAHDEMDNSDDDSGDE